MATDASIPRTRRAILAGGIGGVVALIASGLGRPFPARAGTDGDVVLGEMNDAPNETIINLDESASSSTALSAQSMFGTGGIGLMGRSSTGVGVYGHSSDGGQGDTLGRGKIGVRGTAMHDATSIGVYGEASTGVGVFGGSGATATLATPPKTGVYGYAAQDGNARGVWGQSTTGRGVYGQATTGHGVRGYATTGTAGYFQSQAPTAGYALRAIGRVRFDQCAGRATITAGTRSVTVAPGIDLTSTAAVVATLQGNAGGSTTVKQVSVNTSADTFTIWLTANSTADVKVAWIVLG